MVEAAGDGGRVGGMSGQGWDTGYVVAGLGVGAMVGAMAGVETMAGGGSGGCGCLGKNGSLMGRSALAGSSGSCALNQCHDRERMRPKCRMQVRRDGAVRSPRGRDGRQSNAGYNRVKDASRIQERTHSTQRYLYIKIPSLTSTDTLIGR